MIDPRTDKSGFSDLCRVAAGVIGSDNPVLLSVLEKDYWVTRVLYAIAEHHADHVVFKGGTSLAKGLGITQRFSEDIDLVVDIGNRGASAAHTLLKAIANDAANQCALAMSVRDSERGVHRSVAYAFDALWSSGELIKPTVLLEMGTRSVLVPSSPRVLKSMLANAVPKAAAELPECEMPVLDAQRTLVEKLFVVHAAATRHLANPASGSLNRVGRHYYDVFRLLADVTVNASVGTSSFWSMADDQNTRGAREFPNHHIGPDGLNFAGSVGLFPAAQLSVDVRQEYERDRVLFLGDSPTFDEILAALETVRPRLRR